LSSLNINIKKKIFFLKINNKKMDNLIFKNLTLKIPKGEFTCIFGPSGCGKTTLLNIISGLDNEYNGKVDFNNKSLKSKENKIGYMFQSPRLFPWLTAIENIRFPIKKKNSLSNARLLLKMVGLEKFENSYPHKLSGGMQRRVSLARAFSTNPDLLLLDEPFISLDKKIADQLRNLLINLWKKNRPTIVFVTHDLDEAISLSDRIIFISKLPSKIMLDYKINLQRPRNVNSAKIKSLKRLLSATVKN